MNHALNVSNLRTVASILLGTTVLASTVGCEQDPSVTQAEEFGARFAQLSEEYRKLASGRSLITETGPSENTSDLSGLLGSLNQLSGGTPEQSSAAALLRAKVATDLGTFQAGRAARIEAASRGLFDLIGAIASAAAQVETLSTAEVSLANDRERLAKARSEAETETGMLRTLIARSRDPIARLNADQERLASEIASLDGEIAELKRAAAAAGPRAGFPLVEEAADLQSESIRLRTRSALESGLLASVSGELGLAESALVAAEAKTGAAEAGLKELEDFSAALDRDSQAGRELVNTLRAEAEALLAKVEELRGTSLEELYSSAATAFDEAGAAAESAGNVAREAANQFKFGALRARGAMIQSRMAGLDAEAALRTRLGDAGSLFGGVAKAKSAVEELAGRRATLLEEGKTAYGEALAMMESMGTDQPAIARTKASLEASQAMLEGSAPPSTSADRGTDGSAPTGGFASPKALVDFVNSIDRSSLRGGMKAFEVMRASEPAGKAFIDSSRSMLDALMPFFTAAETAFGADEVAKAATSGMGGMGAAPMLASLENLSLLSEDAESAQATTGGGKTISLVNVDGAWFIDADTLAGSMGGLGQGLAAAGPMLAMIKPALTEAAVGLAGRIESGEFSDAGAAMAAFNDAMRDAMGKAMGGFGGGGFGGGQR